jgi:hypothetical protein
MQCYGMVYDLYMDNRFSTGGTCIEFGITSQWHYYMCRLQYRNSDRSSRQWRLYRSN